MVAYIGHASQSGGLATASVSLSVPGASAGDQYALLISARNPLTISGLHSAWTAVGVSPATHPYWAGGRVYAYTAPVGTPTSFTVTGSGGFEFDARWTAALFAIRDPAGAPTFDPAWNETPGATPGFTLPSDGVAVTNRIFRNHSVVPGVSAANDGVVRELLTSPCAGLTSVAGATGDVGVSLVKPTSSNTIPNNQSLVGVLHFPGPTEPIAAGRRGLGLIRG